MRRRLVFGVLAMVVVSSSVGWAADGDSGPSDSDLMFEALKQWRGEPSSDGAAVERLLAAAKRESRQRREAIRHGATSNFFRDPFSDNPHKLIPVRREDRELLDNLREGSRARAEMLLARAEAARARADATAAKAEADRAQRLAARADAVAAERQALADQAGCTEGRSPEASRESRSGDSEGELASAGRMRRVRSHRHAARGNQTVARAVASNERASQPIPSEEPTPVSATDSADRPPAGWTSADSRGILVVPIEASISQARKAARLH
ncbi:MAG TPA: hypothetical protein VFG23_03395 [Polyangia bacterium]|nr:hypothetical protein [Polyangia bacterium]